MKNKFSIKIKGSVFTSDEDGYLDLNEIWNEFKLSESKKPSKWRTEASRILKERTKLSLKEIKHLGAGKSKFYVADEEATIAYSMWIDVDFYLTVVEAFKELRNGRIEEAVSLASSTMSEEDSHYLNRQMKLKGMFWDEACAYAGIKHPRLLKQELLKHPRFNYFNENGVVNDNHPYAGTYFYNRGNKFTSNVRLCVTPEGREWLRKYNSKFQELVDYRAEDGNPF